jgi:pyrroline-5-carboxylate reductase
VTLAEFPAPAWLVGCGNMAGAMVDGWRKAGIDLGTVTVIRPSGKPVDGVRVVTDYLGSKPRFVMLGVKPQKLDEIVPALRPHVGEDTILVSILAGTSAASLADRFPRTRAIVRAMPNLPVAHGKGVTALYCDHGDEVAKAAVSALMDVLGFAPWVASEDDFSAVGAVAGSGPAYVARFIDALAEGACGLGLEGGLAARIAIETLVGTAAMAETGEAMDALARRVASPKGTTEQGLAVLDDPQRGLQPLIARMLEAAIERGRQMAAEAARRG